MLHFQIGDDHFVVHPSHAEHGDSLRAILATELDTYLGRCGSTCSGRQAASSAATGRDLVAPAGDLRRGGDADLDHEVDRPPDWPEL